MTDEPNEPGPTQATVQAEPDKPSRRTFLALTAMGATMAATAGGVTWWIKHRGEQDLLDPPEPLSETGQTLATMLADRLSMLRVPQVTISKWVNRYEQHKGPWKRKRVSRKDCQNFLLSTDFFPEANEDKLLRFVAFYDPYISVCYNPLRHAK